MSATIRFKIGDFSQLGQVSVRTLRLYDELNLIKPAETDPWTGYRYYTLDQLSRLNRVLALKDLGLSLEQIAQLLQRDLPARQMRGMLQQKQAELEQQMLDMRVQMQRVEARLTQIENENAPPRYEVVMKQVDAAAIASVRTIVPHVRDMGTVRCKKLTELYDTLAEHHIKRLDPEIFVYHLPAYDDENIDMEVATTVEPEMLERFPTGVGSLSVRELPAVSMLASVIHNGWLGDIPNAIVALYNWVGKNGLKSEGGYREIHHGWRESEPPDPTTMPRVTVELQLPVTPLDPD